MTFTSLSYQERHKINIPIQPLKLTAVKNKGSLQAPSKEL